MLAGEMLMRNGGSGDDAPKKRRYRVFFATEAFLLLLTMLLCAGVFAFRPHGTWIACVLATFGMWHIVAIPICFFYLIGKPIVITLSPLVPSAESRAFKRQLQGRSDLSNQEFYTQFYHDSGIPADVPAWVRRSLWELDPLVERASPSDLLYLLDDELDWGDVLDIVGYEFGIRFANTDKEWLNGTLDNLIRLVHERYRPESGGETSSRSLPSDVAQG
jgi:hypothetical protein